MGRSSINIAGIQGAGRADSSVRRERERERERARLLDRDDEQLAGGAEPAKKWTSMLTGPMLKELDGSVSLDAFCCRLELPPAAVLLHPAVTILYK